MVLLTKFAAALLAFLISGTPAPLKSDFEIRQGSHFRYAVVHVEAIHQRLGNGGTFTVSPTGCLLWQGIDPNSPKALVFLVSNVRTFRANLIFSSTDIVRIGQFYKAGMDWFNSPIDEPVLVSYAKSCGYDKSSGIYYFEHWGE